MTTVEEIRQALARGQNIEASEFCHTLFVNVSRTFAINVVRLPKPLVFPVLVSYLLCRIADTVEDDPQLSPQEKMGYLREFTTLLTDEKWREHVGEFTSHCQVLDSSRTDVLLTQHSHYVLECFHQFMPKVQAHIAQWVTELAQGMGKYALRKAEAQAVTFLRSMDDVEEYCYYVAGTVGHLLNGLFYHYCPLIDRSLYSRLEEKATAFGLGLQLTNIIKDSIVDYERGWCYLPEDMLQGMNLSYDNFVHPHQREAAQELMARIIRRAGEHLDDALAYTLLLPRRALRIRIFCVLPMMMASETLRHAIYNEQLFDADNPVKISRQLVQNIIRKAYIYCWSNLLLRRWYRKVHCLLRQKKGEGR